MKTENKCSPKDPLRTLPSWQNNRVEGRLSEMTADFVSELIFSLAATHPVGDKMLLSFAGDEGYKTLQCAMLAACIAAGAEACQLVGCGDRSWAKFAMRKYNINRGLFVTITAKTASVEILGENGAPAHQHILLKLHSGMPQKKNNTASVDFKPPIAINNLPVQYFKDLVMSTACKQLHGTVIISCPQKIFGIHLQKICAAFGLSVLVTNESAVMHDLFVHHRPLLGLMLDCNGSYTLLDENGTAVSFHAFYALVTLIAASAIQNAELYVPDDAQKNAVVTAAYCNATLCPVPKEEFEPLLLRLHTTAARLEHDLCFDPIRCIIRICEFLYINHITLTEVCGILSALAAPQTVNL